VLGECRLPDLDCRGGATSARQLAQCGIAAKQRTAIALKGREIPPRAERENDIEEAAPLGRAPCDELDIAWSDDDAGERAERFAELPQLGAVEPYTLPFRLSFVADTDLTALTARDVRGDVKPRRSECREIVVARSAHGAQELEIVDRLEQIRLALAVVTDQRDAIGWQRQVEASEIPEVADADVPEPHASTGRPVDRRTRHGGNHRGAPGSRTNTVSSTVTSKSWVSRAIAWMLTGVSADASAGTRNANSIFTESAETRLSRRLAMLSPVVAVTWRKTIPVASSAYA
jgi:hypothetical protein